MSPAVISASRRTDIPAFYSDWFAHRLREGWCETANPFSGRRARVSLAPTDVLGWVFWSRDYRPFFSILERLHAQGQRFLCHLTLTGFPRSLEPRCPSVEDGVAMARRLACAFGAQVVQWRYDPILLTSLTPPDWHRSQFGRLAEALEGATRRCLFSFPTMYRKTLRNLGARAGAGSFRVWSRRAGDFTCEDLAALAGDLAVEASGRDMEMRVCCGPDWIGEQTGISPAACVDWPLLRELGAGRHLALDEDASSPAQMLQVPRTPSRPGCGCYRSTDIGAYDTCAHGCVYCYAVNDPEQALRNSEGHDPFSPCL